MSAVEMINNFGQEIVVTRKKTGGSYVNGKWVPTNDCNFKIIMAVQPLTTHEQLNLPEGQRTRDSLKGYTTTRLYTVRQGEDKKADKICYDDRDFEVQQVQKWDDGLSHYKITLVEVNPQ